VGAPHESEQVLAALLQHPFAQQQAQRIRLLLTRACLDQSKAGSAMPLLDELSADASLTPRDTAEAARLRAAALYLLNCDTTLAHQQAAEAALLAARKAEDRELIGRALFEFARSGAEAGDEARVRAAENEIEALLADESNQRLHTLWYARGFCHFFSYELRKAAASVKTAIALLRDVPDVVALSLAYNALGICKCWSCEFAEAEESLNAALGLARKMGDDFRASTAASNLCSLHVLRGNASEAVGLGKLSVEIGRAAPTQPNLMSSYTNLAEAYMLCGERERAVDCLEAAKTWMHGERSWRANIGYLCDSANIALLMGNIALALQLIESVRSIARGRERAVPEPGAFRKLMIFRAEHLEDGQQTLAMARDALERFRDRATVHYLQVLAVTAWLERRRFGSYTTETEHELQLFDSLGANGLRASLAAQGFIA